MTENAPVSPPILILTAIPVEYLAVRAHLSDVREVLHPYGTIYERGIFSAGSQTWEVAIVEIGAGNAGAASAVERAVNYFHASLVFFVGIAGGIKDVKIGDVVVSTKIYGYDSGKAEDTFQVRPNVGLSSFRLEQRAMAEARKPDWLQYIQEPLSTLPPRVYVAPIAAGEKVVASTRSATWEFIRDHYNDALAVEMEGYGFLQAVHAMSNVEAIVIRGISDLIDNKQETDAAHSQEIAARNASAFAFQLLVKLSISVSISLPPQSPAANIQPVSSSGQDDPLEIFFSYAEEDEAFVKQLSNQLSILKRNRLITNWYAKDISAGLERDKEALKHLNAASIILLLVSASFMASEPHSFEVQRAMERSRAREAIVIPILLSPIAYIQDTEFGKLQFVPRNGKPAALWANQDAAFAQIAEEIGGVVKNLKQKNKR